MVRFFLNTPGRMVLKKSKSQSGFLGSEEMPSYRRNALGSFAPMAAALRCDRPQTNNMSSPITAGAVCGGTGNFCSLHHISAPYFISLQKYFYRTDFSETLQEDVLKFL
jgi:hypothetical protein